MDEQDAFKQLKELGNLYHRFKPLYRAEVLTGLAGLGFTSYGFYEPDIDKIGAGILVTALSGFYLAYKTGHFSTKKDTRNSDIENKLND